jgi:hypothetical protein
MAGFDREIQNIRELAKGNGHDLPPFKRTGEAREHVTRTAEATCRRCGILVRLTYRSNGLGVAASSDRRGAYNTRCPGTEEEFRKNNSLGLNLYSHTAHS